MFTVYLKCWRSCRGVRSIFESLFIPVCDSHAPFKQIKIPHKPPPWSMTLIVLPHCDLYKIAFEGSAIEQKNKKNRERKKKEKNKNKSRKRKEKRKTRTFGWLFLGVEASIRVQHKFVLGTQNPYSPPTTWKLTFFRWLVIMWNHHDEDKC